MPVKGPTYREADGSSAEMPDLIVVSDLKAANALPDQGDLIFGMLLAVAYGISLVDEHTWVKEKDPFMAAACVRHVPSVEKVPAILSLTEAFQTKHRHCSQLLKTASAWPGSKWRIAAEEKAGEKQHRVDCAEDVAAFVRRVRRLNRPSGQMQGSLFPAEWEDWRLPKAAAQKKAKAKAVPAVGARARDSGPKSLRSLR